MLFIPKSENPFVDSQFSLIKKIYEIPTYEGLPRISVCMAFGSTYSNSGFNASGAGITYDDAKISAIGEYVERYCALHPRNSVLNSEIGKYDQQVNPELFSQYLNGPFDFKNKSIGWIEGTELVSSDIVLLPAEVFYLTYTNQENKRIWISNSTGASCGTELNHVIWKGLAEAFERDAIQFTWRTQMSIPKIDFRSNEKVNSFYETYIHSDVVKVSLFKFVMDWDVPAVFGIAEVNNGATVVAAAVRDNWEDACIKTLIELSQSIVGYGSVIFNNDYPDYNEDFSNVRTYEDHSLLYFNPTMRKHLDFLLKNDEIVTIPTNEGTKSDEEILEWFLAELKKIDREAYFANLTSPEIAEYGWLVGRVIVPGFLDIEPNFIKVMKSERIPALKQYILEKGLRLEGHFHGSPIAPHPFP